jgi:undecaprenyl-diphosphatase
VLVGLGHGKSGAIAFTRNIMLAFLPSAVIGLIVYKAVKAMLESATIVAVALIVGGVAILVIERMVKHPRIHSVETIGWRTALGIGLIQCLSMIPGVSRSGATILGALSLGVERKTAAEFSFFLAVPTMLAATGYDLFKTGAQLGDGDWLAIAIGFAVSFVVALVVIRWFVGIVSRHGFAPFAWYRIVAGSVALILLQLG